MGRELTAAELDALLGAYVLDALDDDERTQVEAWLERVPRARRDADELRETASLLAQFRADPPRELWSRIEEQLGEAPPPLRLAPVVPLDGERSTRAPRRRRSWLVPVAAALALVIAVALGVVVARQNTNQDARIDQMAAGLERNGMRRAALAAAMEPGARAAELATIDGTVMAKVVATVDGRGYFMAKKMAALPRGRTYQLWAVMGERPGSPVVSVGVLGRSPTVTGFNADPSVSSFAVTREDAPGVATSSQAAMVTGRLA
jgi:hypothetical protein